VNAQCRFEHGVVRRVVVADEIPRLPLVGSHAGVLGALRDGEQEAEIGRRGCEGAGPAAAPAGEVEARGGQRARRALGLQEGHVRGLVLLNLLERRQRGARDAATHRGERVVLCGDTAHAEDGGVELVLEDLEREGEVEHGLEIRRQGGALPERLGGERGERDGDGCHRQARHHGAARGGTLRDCLSARDQTLGDLGVDPVEDGDVCAVHVLKAPGVRRVSSRRAPAGPRWPRRSAAR
jgi:hypothetical protein